MLLTVLVFAVSFAATFLAVPVLIRKLREAGITGKEQLLVYCSQFLHNCLCQPIECTFNGW